LTLRGVSSPDAGAEPGGAGPGLVALFVGTLRHPRVALAELASRRTRLWLAPAVALSLSGTLAALVMLPSALDATRGEFDARYESGFVESSPDADAETAAQREQTVNSVLSAVAAAAVVQAALAPLLAAPVVAAILHLAGTVLGGQQSYGQMLVATSWARLPFLFQDALRVAYGAAGGYEERMDGLAGLVPGGHPAGPLLAELSVWNVWSLALLAISVAVVSQVSLRKAAAAVAGFVALKVGLGELSVAVSRFMSGLGG
jgi:hypothetical protein